MTTSVYNVTCSTSPGASRANLSTGSSIGQPRRGRSRHRCSRVLVRALLAFLAGASLSACTMELPLELDPDVVAISLLLESGERSAKMAASHPHRKWDEAPPDIGARLEGPGWTVEFAATDPTAECGSLPLYRASTCLSAQLPEAVAPGRYRVRGTTPLGSFSGEATVPATPRMEDPAGDTVRIHLPRRIRGEVLVPLEYQVDSATAALFLEASWGDHTADERGRGLWELGDSIWWPYEEGDHLTRGLRLRLQALGPNYASWLRHVGLDVGPPWPSFGIEGEGVYGYFDGVSAPTRWVYIVFER